jgi:hypothetical protein
MANILLVFRLPFTFLVAIVLTIGPTYFQQVHESEVNEALAKITAPKVAGNTPLKRLPVQSPTHDPASCPVCVALHAPIVSQVATAPSLLPLDRLGTVAQLPAESFHSINVTADHCRGPPIA